MPYSVRILNALKCDPPKSVAIRQQICSTLPRRWQIWFFKSNCFCRNEFTSMHKRNYHKIIQSSFHKNNPLRRLPRPVHELKRSARINPASQPIFARYPSMSQGPNRDHMRMLLVLSDLLSRWSTMFFFYVMILLSRASLQVGKIIERCVSDHRW